MLYLGLQWGQNDTTIPHPLQYVAVLLKLYRVSPLFYRKPLEFEALELPQHITERLLMTPGVFKVNIDHFVSFVRRTEVISAERDLMTSCAVLQNGPTKNNVKKSINIIKILKKLNKALSYRRKKLVSVPLVSFVNSDLIS